MRRNSFFILFILFFALITDVAFGTDNFGAPVPREQPEPFAVKFQRQYAPGRKAVIDPDIVVKVMDLTPGMTVLDIGAGAGYFTFPFARALKGEGTVYATDVDGEMVEHLKGEVQRQEYGNVVPVLVTGVGVDPFYRVHSFDVIFLSSVYYHLVDHEAYFRELRPSLDKKGRLFLAEPVPFGALDTDMFGDFQSTLTRLLEDGEDSPFYQRLSKDTRRLLGERPAPENPVAPDLQEHLVADFERMLTDHGLYPDFVAYYRVKFDLSPRDALSKMLTTEYFQLTKWLVGLLEGSDAFDPRAGKLSKVDQERLWVLNRTLLLSYFQLYDKTAWFFLPQKTTIIRTLEAAGYALVKEHTVLKYHYFLEFKRKE